MEAEWGFLLVDARNRNAFNEGNRTAMLWTIRHRWPSGARFAFNCHHATLVIRTEEGTAIFVFSEEGVTQGGPLSMNVYGIGMLPLVLELKRLIAEVRQPWFADDSGDAGTFAGIRRFFEKLQELGSLVGSEIDGALGQHRELLGFELYAALLERIEHEWTTRKRIFDLPTARFWKPDPNIDLSFEFLGRQAVDDVTLARVIAELFE